MSDIVKSILSEIPDKSKWSSTTSLQFKSDLADWCGDRFKDDVVLEVGSHVGQTTMILSLLFKEVYTINLNPPASDDNNLFEIDEYLEENDHYQLYKCNLRNNQNHKFENVYYIRQDSYESRGWCPKIPDVRVCFIDAVHTYDAVVEDIEKALLKNTEYFVFDDYGLYPEIKDAVDKYVELGVLKVERHLGWSKGKNNVGGMHKVFHDREGIICSRV